jgi:bifunctional N-acetylglucosamine-1-phosphate-uridyltransferase/glucosamine-1-phosphate-acetyltransferase GlmU-like protein
MRSNLPKALHLVDGTPNVVRNSKMVDDFRVVINHCDVDVFLEYFSRDKLVEIESGLGSGHAIMQLELEENDIIIWGDAVIVNPLIIKELSETDSKTLKIPLKKVDNPYVNFCVDEQFSIHEVMFSKYNEHSSKGYQDCCIFKVPYQFVRYLRALHNAIWKSRYITESEEFEFLYIAHYLNNVGNPAKGYLTEYPNAIYSYNTVEELNTIEQIIRENKQ